MGRSTCGNLLDPPVRGDPRALGAPLQVGPHPLTVIGVMPPGFFGADPSKVPDFWVPMSLEPDPDEVWVLGRRKPGVNLFQVRADLEPAFQHALASLGRPDSASQRLAVAGAAAGTVDLRWSVWEGSRTLRILLGLSGLVLLIACANLASLSLAHAASRAGEMRLRHALGVFWITPLIRHLLYGIRPQDPFAFLGASLLLLLTAALAAYVPARGAAKGDPGAALRVQ